MESATNTSAKSSKPEGEPKIIRTRSASLDEGGGMSRSDHPSQTRSSSRRRTIGDCIEAMDIPVARSFHALDPNSSISKRDILDEQDILKKSSNGPENIQPAPESPTEHTEDSDSCSFKNEREGGNELTDLEAGTGGDRKTSVNSERRVLFEEPSPSDNIDDSYHCRASRLGSMRGLTRQISQFLLPQSEDRRKSMTAQRYDRKKSVMNVLRSDTSQRFGNIESFDDLSDDTVHRLKSICCCVAFALVLCAMLYYMLKR